jgi:hypothetical protein
VNFMCRGEAIRGGRQGLRLLLYALRAHAGSMTTGGWFGSISGPSGVGTVQEGWGQCSTLGDSIDHTRTPGRVHPMSVGVWEFL